MSFFSSYVEAALWSSTDDNDRPMDSHYSESNLSDGTRKAMLEDCEKFLKEHGMLFSQAQHGRAGHNFWLSRNGHGSGFFDEDDLSENVRDRLQKAAKSFGEFTLYVRFDGTIYHYHG